MDVVLPGDADAAVDLHAVVDEVEAPIGDVRLGHAHEPRGVFVALARRRPAPRASLIDFENSSHTSMSAMRCFSAWNEAIGPAERVAILRVLDGELEHAVGGTDGFGALQRERDLELVLHCGGRASDLADAPPKPGRVRRRS